MDTKHNNGMCSRKSAHQRKRIISCIGNTLRAPNTKTRSRCNMRSLVVYERQNFYIRLKWHLINLIKHECSDRS